MLRALYSSASGMQSQQMNLDVIANNLANVHTTGFKKSKIEFQDLLYQTNRAAGAESGAGNQVPTSLQVGHGSRAVSTAKIFTAGEIMQTGERMDLAIHGNGFFKVTMPDGTTIMIENEEGWLSLGEWYARNGEAEEEPLLQYPVNIVLFDDEGEETTVTINNEEEMNALEEECWGNDGEGDRQ